MEAEAALVTSTTVNRGGFRGKGRGGNRGRGGTQSQQQQGKPIQPKHQLAAGLPPPQMFNKNAEAAAKVTTKEESIFNETVFSSERVLKPARRETNFTPSCTGFMPLVNDVYASYKSERKKQLAKEFPPELFRYYNACLFWMRVIGLKRSSGVGLTDAESRVYQALKDKTFHIPEPIFLALKSIGKVVAKTGEVFYPEFPDLPTERVNGME